MFLALAFRPGDSHCIHVDIKASEGVKEAIKNIVKCYKEAYPESNIFVATNPVSVYWGHISTLEVIQKFSDEFASTQHFLFQADLTCLRALLLRDDRWQFYINPAGTELPLLPIETMDQVMSMHSTSVVDSFRSRWKVRQERMWTLARHVLYHFCYSYLYFFSICVTFLSG